MRIKGARARNAGFTLMESVIVLVLLGILTAVALMKNAGPGAYTLQSQAERLAADVRHVQSLATTWGKTLTITLTGGTNGSYSISCSTSGASPCNANPVLDPSTGASYTVALKNNASISGPATYSFDSFGKPTTTANASYSVSANGASFTVTVYALTGLVAVSTP